MTSVLLQRQLRLVVPFVEGASSVSTRSAVDFGPVSGGNYVLQLLVGDRYSRRLRRRDCAMGVLVDSCSLAELHHAHFANRVRQYSVPA